MPSHEPVCVPPRAAFLAARKAAVRTGAGVAVAGTVAATARTSPSAAMPGLPARQDTGV